MSFDTPDEAAHSFAVAVQATLACITDRDVTYAWAQPLNQSRAIVLNEGDETPIGNGLYLSVSHTYAVRQVASDAFAVSTGGYAYAIDSDDTGGEIYSWHWHPDGPSACTWPHAHVQQPLGDHFPTGRVALEDVVRWLILEAHIDPIRPDWPDVLEANRAQYNELRTW